MERSRPYVCHLRLNVAGLPKCGSKQRAHRLREVRVVADLTMCALLADGLSSLHSTSILCVPPGVADIGAPSLICCKAWASCIVRQRPMIALRRRSFGTRLSAQRCARAFRDGPSSVSEDIGRGDDRLRSGAFVRLLRPSFCFKHGCWHTGEVVGVLAGGADLHSGHGSPRLVHCAVVSGAFESCIVFVRVRVSRTRRLDKFRRAVLPTRGGGPS